MGVTLKDIATATGFAPSTISNVLNGHATCYASAETRKKIQAAAQQLGYQPNYFASGLRRQRSMLIGVAASPFGSEVAVRIMRAVARELLAAGYQTLFSDTASEPERESVVVGDLLRRQVDGLIVHCLGQHAAALLDQVGPLPVALLTAPLVDGQPCVFVDQALAVEQAVGHLVGLGHRRILQAVAGIDSNQRKVEGYRRGMAAHGLARYAQVIETGGRPGDTRATLLADPLRFAGYSAVLAGSDQIACEIIGALRRLGRQVPRDCAVIGFDDSSFALAADPLLTTLRQPADAIGKALVTLLLERLLGQPARHVIFVPELIVRESVAPPACP